MISRGIMAQVRCLIVGRLRSKHEIDVLAEELSGLAGSKDDALALLDYATAEPFSFLFVRLDKTNKHAFWLRFEKRLGIEETDDDAQQLDDSKREAEQTRAHGQQSGPTAGRTQHARRSRN